MNKLKYIGAVLIALAGLGLQQAKADTIYSISVGNTALTSAGFTGPYATVDVHLVSPTVATVTFTGLTQTISGTTYQYLFGDSGSVAVNVNASTWTISGISGTNSGTGFTPGAFSNGGSGNEDGFGVMNQQVTDFDGYTHSANVVTFTLTNTSGTWASSASVLIANANGSIVGAHIFVTTSPANASSSANVTGFAANGGAVNTPDGGTTVMLLGAALGALGMARRFLMS
jgi:VPDSG-CTERM motif